MNYINILEVMVGILAVAYTMPLLNALFRKIASINIFNKQDKEDED